MRLYKHKYIIQSSINLEVWKNANEHVRKIDSAINFAHFFQHNVRLISSMKILSCLYKCPKLYWACFISVHYSKEKYVYLDHIPSKCSMFVAPRLLFFSADIFNTMNLWNNLTFRNPNQVMPYIISPLIFRINSEI